MTRITENNEFESANTSPVENKKDEFVHFSESDNYLQRAAKLYLEALSYQQQGDSIKNMQCSAASKELYNMASQAQRKL